MVAFLKAQGFEKYTTKEFVVRLDEELACDSIEDLAILPEDEEYRELGITTEEAEKIGRAAQRELLRRFLLSVPLPNGSTTGYYAQFVDALFEAGYEELDDIEDLEADDAKELGLTREEAVYLASKAEEWEARAMFNALLWTYESSGRTFPFREEAVLTQISSALIAAGLRTLEDVGRAKDVPGILVEDLVKLQGSPSVLEHTRKQEL